jgi:hypothetical protein
MTLAQNSDASHQKCEQIFVTKRGRKEEKGTKKHKVEFHLSRHYRKIELKFCFHSSSIVIIFILLYVKNIFFIFILINFLHFVCIFLNICCISALFSILCVCLCVNFKRNLLIYFFIKGNSLFDFLPRSQRVTNVWRCWWWRARKYFYFTYFKVRSWKSV